jgi:hypothetical protein
VLDAFKAAGPVGLTDEQCARAAGIERPHSAATRRAELQARGAPIYKTSLRRPTSSGKSAIVWRYEL